MSRILEGLLGDQKWIEESMTRLLDEMWNPGTQMRLDKLVSDLVNVRTRIDIVKALEANNFDDVYCYAISLQDTHQ